MIPAVEEKEAYKQVSVDMGIQEGGREGGSRMGENCFTLPCLIPYLRSSKTC